MAKKIVTKNSQKASASLKKRKIEHVLVQHKDDAFVVVLNKDVCDAIAVIKVDNQDVLRVKNVRHYEMIALRHTHYQPQFECKCRQCGKTFMHPIKEAAWCSKKCKQAFRKTKKQEK